VLKKFNKTVMRLQHRLQGSDTYNPTSARSALRGDYSAAGTSTSAATITGRGEEDPIASNATDGRAQNRHVEIQLSPIRA
jgi:outer membrane protein OmpA-like peptidoglycan-associated protein